MYIIMPLIFHKHVYTKAIARKKMLQSFNVIMSLCREVHMYKRNVQAMQRGGALKPFSCSIQNKTLAQMQLTAMCFNETILEET